MENNKLNEGLESLNRIKLLMSYRNDMTLTENEENLNNSLLVEQPTPKPTSKGKSPTSKPTSTAQKGLTGIGKYIPKSGKGKAALGIAAAGLVASTIGKLSQFLESEPTDEFDSLKNFYNVGETLYKSKNDKSSLDFFTAKDISLDKSPNFDVNAVINTYNSAYDYNIAGFPLGENEEAMRDSILECQTVVDFYLFCIRIGGITKLIEQLKKVPNEYIKQIVNSHLNDDYLKTKEVVTEYKGVTTEKATAEKATAEKVAADNAKKIEFISALKKEYSGFDKMTKDDVTVNGDVYGIDGYQIKYDGANFTFIQ